LAASALRAGAMAKNPRYSIAFSADGSFLMNPQIIVDAKSAPQRRYRSDARNEQD
jgi:thiamine pyrophosphate-dependent acetolactate synthase large subunit-like protein